MPEQASGRLESFYDLPQESRDAISRARFKRQLPLENFTDSVSWKNLVALLDFLEDRGAQVCIVRKPIIPEYSQAIDENPEGKRFTAALEALRLQSDHRSGVSFRDFTAVVAELPGFYFKNQDHLNALGRKAYWPTVERACFDEEAIEPLLYH